MRIEGITGIYKKTYLDNDLYRFDFSHHVNGYLDDETGCFYDEYDNEIPYIRDTTFLDSKENIGHYGFLRYEDLPYTFLSNTDEEMSDLDFYLYAYDTDCKNRMVLVSVLEDFDSNTLDTVVTEIDLEDIHKKSISYYLDFITSDEVITKKVLTMDFDISTEDLIKLIKADKFSYEELKVLLVKYMEPYKDAYKVLEKCSEIINEVSEGKVKLSSEGRDPKFNIDEPLEINLLFDVLDKRQVTIPELKKLFEKFDDYLKQLEPVIDVIKNKINKLSEEIEEVEELKKNVREQVKEISEEKDKNIDKEQYSLDDLKKLRGVVKEYLVGQDEPLRRLVSELSRMKDKDFEDNVGILLSGDSGVGKTFMVQLVAKYLGLPFVRVDSTDLTVPGYVGRDLEEVLWELYENSGKDIDKAEHGILFFDEIDKKGSNRKSDSSGQGVLNVLLKFLDGTTYDACRDTRHSSDIVKIDTSKMKIIAGGAFTDVFNNGKKKNVLGFATGNNEVKEEKEVIPDADTFVQKAFMTHEFMGRFPIRIKLNPHTVESFSRILKESDASTLKEEKNTFDKLGVKLNVTPEFIEKASSEALKLKTGVRGLMGCIEEATWVAFEDVYNNPDKYEEIVLTEETFDDPANYQKVLKKQL